MQRLIILISGSGSNLQAIIDAIAAGRLTAEIVLVAANKKSALGLVRAQEAAIPTCYFPLKPYRQSGRGRAAYDADLAATLAPYRPDLIVLAGWMHILSPAFLDHFPNQVINLHPALPGAFAGTRAIERAFAAYQKGQIEESGCMIHYVIPEIDAGPVIAQRTVPFEQGDTQAAFAERLHAAEHQLIVEAIETVLNDRDPI